MSNENPERWEIVDQVYFSAHKVIDAILEMELPAIDIENFDGDWSNQDDHIILVMNAADQLENTLDLPGHADIVRDRMADACILRAEQFNNLADQERNKQDDD